MSTVYLIAGLAFGDEGKGSVTDFLVRRRQADLVVRYNGGAQAGHNVVTPDGRHHTFEQFGSGTFIPGVKTHLSRFMLINPLTMIREEEHLREVGVTDAWERLTVEAKALIITPYHRAMNRIIEASRGPLSGVTTKRHGSCGHGIGATRELHIDHGDKMLYAVDFLDGYVTKEKLRFIRKICWDKVRHLQGSNLIDDHEFDIFRDATLDWVWNKLMQWPVADSIVSESHLALLLESSKVSVFEGAQGVLLDETYGEAPYNTWTDCTFNNAATLLAESQYHGAVTKVGVARTYFTRHGPGPFPTESKTFQQWHPEPHNTTGIFQGEFRIGAFDYNLARKSIALLHGIDFLALNHIDRISGVEPSNLQPYEAELDVEVGIRGYGPRATDKDWNLKKIGLVAQG